MPWVALKLLEVDKENLIVLQKNILSEKELYRIILYKCVHEDTKVIYSSHTEVKTPEFLPLSRLCFSFRDKAYFCDAKLAIDSNLGERLFFFLFVLCSYTEDLNNINSSFDESNYYNSFESLSEFKETYQGKIKVEGVVGFRFFMISVNFNFISLLNKQACIIPSGSPAAPQAEYGLNTTAFSDSNNDCFTSEFREGENILKSVYTLNEGGNISVDSCRSLNDCLINLTVQDELLPLKCSIHNYFYKSPYFVVLLKNPVTIKPSVYSDLCTFSYFLADKCLILDGPCIYIEEMIKEFTTNNFYFTAFKNPHVGKTILLTCSQRIQVWPCALKKHSSYSMNCTEVAPSITNIYYFMKIGTVLDGSLSYALLLKSSVDSTSVCLPTNTPFISQKSSFVLSLLFIKDLFSTLKDPVKNKGSCHQPSDCFHVKLLKLDIIFKVIKSTSLLLKMPFINYYYKSSWKLSNAFSAEGYLAISTENKELLFYKGSNLVKLFILEEVAESVKIFRNITKEGRLTLF
jgi:hypothetical protein